MSSFFVPRYRSACKLVVVSWRSDLSDSFTISSYLLLICTFPFKRASTEFDVRFVQFSLQKVNANCDKSDLRCSIAVDNHRIDFMPNSSSFFFSLSFEWVERYVMRRLYRQIWASISIAGWYKNLSRTYTKHDDIITIFGMRQFANGVIKIGIWKWNTSFSNGRSMRTNF